MGGKAWSFIDEHLKLPPLLSPIFLCTLPLPISAWLPTNFQGSQAQTRSLSHSCQNLLLPPYLHPPAPLPYPTHYYFCQFEFPVYLTVICSFLLHHHCPVHTAALCVSHLSTPSLSSSHCTSAIFLHITVQLTLHISHLSTHHCSAHVDALYFSHPSIPSLPRPCYCTVLQPSFPGRPPESVSPFNKSSKAAVIILKCHSGLLSSSACSSIQLLTQRNQVDSRAGARVDLESHIDSKSSEQPSKIGSEGFSPAK